MSKKTKLAALAASTSVLLVPVTALAQEAGKAAATNNLDVQAWCAGAAGFAMGIAVLGGALGQGRAAAAALEGISRNPGASEKIQTPMILGLALIESLVLFAFAIAYLLFNTIKLT
jgi:F-type H+-transporting ATPase subunit c